MSNTFYSLSNCYPLAWTAQSIWFVGPFQKQVPIKQQCHDSSRALKVSNYEQKRQNKFQRTVALRCQQLKFKDFLV